MSNLSPPRADFFGCYSSSSQPKIFSFNGISMLEASAQVGMQGGGVAYWAHAGGFVFGAILAPLFGLFNDVKEHNEIESET